MGTGEIFLQGVLTKIKKIKMTDISVITRLWKWRSNLVKKLL